jgi:hypothetical protein
MVDRLLLSGFICYTTIEPQKVFDRSPVFLHQAPFEVLPQETAAYIRTFGQKEHGNLVFHSAVTDEIGVVAVDGLYRIIDRLHTVPSLLNGDSIPYFSPLYKAEISSRTSVPPCGRLAVPALAGQRPELQTLLKEQQLNSLEISGGYAPGSSFTI